MCLHHFIYKLLTMLNKHNKLTTLKVKPCLDTRFEAKNKAIIFFHLLN